MRYPKWFARWRASVWSRRLTKHRHDWNRATLREPSHVTLDGINLDKFYEPLVTRALVQRVKWRKRAGIRKLAQGGPATKGRPYIRGEDRPELFIPSEEGKKLSPPGDRPKP
jgi:hypothetical protein